MLAAAGLERLGISGRKGYTFPVREMIPAAGQGVLAVQGRRGEDYGFLDAVQDPVTWEEAMAERFFIRALGAGCGAPAAVFAQISGNEITILGAYAADRDGPFLKDENSGERRDALTLAEKLALRFLRKGAGL
jgi:hydroxymethylbilane synthase